MNEEHFTSHQQYKHSGTFANRKYEKLSYGNHVGEKAMVRRRRFLKIYSLQFCDIWQDFYFYRILNHENFKMEVEQTNFVTHLIITVQL